MSAETLHSIAIIVVCAVVTYGVRMSAFLIFGSGKDGKPPKWVAYLGNVLPPAVIALLVVYCLRNIDLFSGSHGLPELLCVAVCALLHLWKHNDLLSIFGATGLYMLLVQVVFV